MDFLPPNFIGAAILASPIWRQGHGESGIDFIPSFPFFASGAFSSYRLSFCPCFDLCSLVPTIFFSFVRVIRLYARINGVDRTEPVRALHSPLPHPSCTYHSHGSQLLQLPHPVSVPRRFRFQTAKPGFTSATGLLIHTHSGLVESAGCGTLKLSHNV